MCHKIIVISGLDRVGKSTFGEILASDRCCIFECGEYVRNKARIEQDKSNSLSEYYEKNMNRLNTGIVNQLKKKLNKSSTNKTILAVGVRSKALLDRINKIGCDIVVVFVHAGFNERFKRYKSGRDTKDSFDEYQCRKNDDRQIRWGLQEIANIADIVLDNSASHQDFVHSINKVKVKICKEYLP